MTDTNILDLPSDPLRVILKRIINHHYSSLSLVSKSFRSLIDGFVHTLTFERIPSSSEFRKLLSRFSSVTRIVIHLDRQKSSAMVTIARSQRKIGGLEIFGKVKALKLLGTVDVMVLQVVEFIRLFPALEELDLSLCSVWGDEGIEKLASNSPNLRKIILDNNRDLTDRSLDALGNCVNLEDISFQGCRKITVQGFCAFLRKRKNFKSLRVPRHRLLTTTQGNGYLVLARTISICENLRHLSIDGGLMTDACLCVVAKSPSPLTSLWIGMATDAIDYTMTGVSAMLRAFQGLTELHLKLPQHQPDTHQDMKLSQLVASLTCLKCIFLYSQSSLHATLFSLIQNCTRLKCILISSGCGSNKNCDVPRLTIKNYSVRRILLFPWADYVLKSALKSVCPSLEFVR